MEAEHFNFPYSTGNEGLTKKRRSKKNNSRSRSHSPNLFVHFLTRLHKPQELSSIWESLSNRRKKEILDHCLESIEGAGGTQINAIDNAFSASKFLAVVLKIGKVNEASFIHRYSAEILTKMLPHILQCFALLFAGSGSLIFLRPRTLWSSTRTTST